MRTRSWWPVLACLALGACGGSSNGAHGGGGSGPAAASGEAAKPAATVVADAARALRSAHSYVMQGTITQSGVPLRLKIVVASRTTMEVSFTAGAASVDMLVLAQAAYVRASRSFWLAQLGTQGEGLAGRWVQVPPDPVQGLTASLGPFAPGTLSRCLVEDHGTLSLGGHTTVDGRPAVVVRDAGNAPGSSPGTLAVAASGTPYPLKITATGPGRGGGTIDVCNDGKPTDSHGALTFSRFGSVAPLAAPRNSTSLQPTASA